MKTLTGLLSLGAMLTASPLSAQARPVHPHRSATEAAPVHRASTDGFAARMSRLDALMGIKGTVRTRSASADH